MTNDSDAVGNYGPTKDPQGDALLEALLTFTKADTLTEKQRILDEQGQRLLSAEADQALAAIAARAQRPGKARLAAILTANCYLLRRGRETSLAHAWEELVRDGQQLIKASSSPSFGPHGVDGDNVDPRAVGEALHAWMDVD